MAPEHVADTFGRGLGCDDLIDVLAPAKDVHSVQTQHDVVFEGFGQAHVPNQFVVVHGVVVITSSGLASQLCVETNGCGKLDAGRSLQAK